MTKSLEMWYCCMDLEHIHTRIRIRTRNDKCVNSHWIILLSNTLLMYEMKKKNTNTNTRCTQFTNRNVTKNETENIFTKQTIELNRCELRATSNNISNQMMSLSMSIDENAWIKRHKKKIKIGEYQKKKKKEKNMEKTTLSLDEINFRELLNTHTHSQRHCVGIHDATSLAMQQQCEQKSTITLNNIVI